MNKGWRAFAVVVALLLVSLPTAVTKPAAAAGPGQYSAPVWLPVRNAAKVGCVRTNCSGPYHGYWAIDFLDPNQAAGDPVFAAGAGQAQIVSQGGGCGGPGTPGNSILVDHGNGVTTYYAHLSSFSVADGQWVDENTEIGEMGSTGYTDPCPTVHLHFEKRVNGTKVDPGPLRACQDDQAVTYPQATGYSSWDAVPFQSQTVTSEGSVCETPTDPPANVNEGGGVGSATYRGDRLNSGDLLYAGEYIASPNLRTALVLRANGDLVLYGPNPGNGKGYSVRWSQSTSGADRLVMQGDGNLVVYQGSTPRWWSGTGAAGSYAIVQNDGNLAVRNPAGASQWATGTGGGTAFTYVGSDRLNSGEQLSSNQYIRSADGRYVLLMKSGGTLVLYSAGYHVVWYKARPSADRVVMQGDGNLVMYQGSTAKWSSGNTGSDTRAVMQGDGNFVIYDDATAIWHTKTSGQI